jgi:lysozyme family protein
MKANFSKSLEKVLVHEGGYVDHPKDPGGATNKGVTIGTYQAWLTSKGRPKKHVKYITDQEVAAIYEQNYWDAVNGNLLPSGLDYAVFDGAVNSGPSRSVKWLQRALGVKVDGVMGLDTIGAAQRLSHVQVIATIDKMLDLRMGFLRSLRHWPTFGRGWTNRVRGVRADAKEMADMPNEIIETLPAYRPNLIDFIMNLIDAISNIFIKR